MARRKLNLGCTIERHREIGVHAVINARSGRQDLNDLTLREIDQLRDSWAIAAKKRSRTKIYQWNSRVFRRRSSELAHLVSDYRDE